MATAIKIACFLLLYSKPHCMRNTRKNPIELQGTDQDKKDNSGTKTTAEDIKTQKKNNNRDQRAGLTRPSYNNDMPGGSYTGL
ncbi:MAG: hypothetical protein H0U44_08315 [Flavisolibacter sp.]|jgi:hypothetical protein|nr:hypothetical protein [Flavisolibacter sp.]